MHTKAVEFLFSEAAVMVADAGVLGSRCCCL